MLVDCFMKYRDIHHGKTEGPLSVIYFGDHLRNDVQISKTFMKWNTVAIVEELEELEREFGFLPKTR